MEAKTTAATKWRLGAIEPRALDSVQEIVDAATGDLVAEVYLDGNETTSKARLIAAAPDLLEALYITSNCSPVTKDLEAMSDDTEVTLRFTAEDLKQIRAAIAKAKGGSR